jgi:hypothetical protein
MKARIPELVAAMAALVLAASSAAWADGNVIIRQVRAEREGSGIDAALSDVASVLRGNMPFGQYHLVATRSLGFPAGSTLQLEAGFSVTCTGTRDNLQILLKRGKDKVLQTTVSLAAGTPLVLGGFPVGDSTYLLILTAK